MNGHSSSPHLVCEGSLWVCENHADQPWQHDDWGSAGSPYVCNPEGAVQWHWNQTEAAMPRLVESGGCIVNTASVSGLGGDWDLAFYNASKGAIVNFTRALALDHRRDGVRVNCVCPSLTFMPITADIQRSRKKLAKFTERIPLGRGCQPSEVAAAIAFLASDDASFITGIALLVDGGVTASNGQPRMS